MGVQCLSAVWGQTSSSGKECTKKVHIEKPGPLCFFLSAFGKPPHLWVLFWLVAQRFLHRCRHFFSSTSGIGCHLHFWQSSWSFSQKRAQMGFFLPYSSGCCQDCWKSTVVVGLLPFQQGKEFHDPVGRFDPPLQKPANFFVIWLIWYTVGWLVGGCGARAVSRKTHIYLFDGCWQMSWWCSW